MIKNPPLENTKSHYLQFIIRDFIGIWTLEIQCCFLNYQ